jgi:hypothetical protein
MRVEPGRARALHILGLPITRERGEMHRAAASAQALGHLVTRRVAVVAKDDP